MKLNLIDNYLKEHCSGCTNASTAKIKQALKRLSHILEEFIKRYGVEPLYNTKGHIDTDGIYAVGKVLQLEKVLTQAPTPITINKHSKFIKTYIEAKTNGFNHSNFGKKDSD